LRLLKLPGVPMTNEATPFPVVESFWLMAVSWLEKFNWAHSMV